MQHWVNSFPPLCINGATMTMTHTNRTKSDAEPLRALFRHRFSSNAVIKEHDVGEQIASAGPGLMWKVRPGGGGVASH